MGLLRTPPGRRSQVMDHLIAGAGCLAAAAVSGAVLTLAAQFGESRLGLDPNRALAGVWATGAGLMATPMLALPMLLPGAGLLVLARRLGAGGWGIAALIGLGLTGFRFGTVAVADLGGVLAAGVGVALGLGYWEILRQRCNGRLSAAS